MRNGSFSNPKFPHFLPSLIRSCEQASSPPSSLLLTAFTAAASTNPYDRHRVSQSLQPQPRVTGVDATFQLPPWRGVDWIFHHPPVPSFSGPTAIPSPPGAGPQASLCVCRPLCATAVCASVREAGHQTTPGPCGVQRCVFFLTFHGGPGVCGRGRSSAETDAVRTTRGLGTRGGCAPSSQRLSPRRASGCWASVPGRERGGRARQSRALAPTPSTRLHAAPTPVAAAKQPVTEHGGARCPQTPGKPRVRVGAHGFISGCFRASPRYPRDCRAEALSYHGEQW